MNQNLWDEYVQTVRELRDANAASKQAAALAEAASDNQQAAYKAWAIKREEMLGAAELELR